MLQVGAYAGIASRRRRRRRLPDLLRRADIALEQAASGRTARPVWFDGGMERALIAHGEIEQGIRFALEHEQFLPYFEPQVDLATGEIVGFEVLARWNHPLSGPDQAGNVHPGRRGTWPDRAAVGAGHRRGAGRIATWDPALTMAVNISPMQLADPWLAQRIVRLLTEAGIPARAAGGRDHRKLAVRRPRAGAVDHHQPQEPGHPPGARRFRDRLLVAVAPALAAVRRDQDRPQLHRHDQPGPRKRGDRPRRDHARPARSTCR